MKSLIYFILSMLAIGSLFAVIGSNEINQNNEVRLWYEARAELIAEADAKEKPVDVVILTVEGKTFYIIEQTDGHVRVQYTPHEIPKAHLF